jgi:hypothetical protein
MSVWSIQLVTPPRLEFLFNNVPLSASFVWELVEPFLCRRAPVKLAGKKVDLFSVGVGLVNVGLESS